MAADAALGWGGGGLRGAGSEGWRRSRRSQRNRRRLRQWGSTKLRRSEDGASVKPPSSLEIILWKYINIFTSKLNEGYSLVRGCGAPWAQAADAAATSGARAHRRSAIPAHATAPQQSGTTPSQGLRHQPRPRCLRAHVQGCCPSRRSPPCCRLLPRSRSTRHYSLLYCRQRQCGRRQPPA